MTEDRWLACDDPVAMLRFLQGRAGERKLRLLACACARLQWERLQDGLMREAVEVGERFADGLVRWPEVQLIVHRLYGLPGEFRKEFGRNWFCEQETETVAAYFAAISSVGAGVSKLPDRMSWVEQSKITGPRQPALVREIFGNPFAPITIDHIRLMIEAVRHARAAYDERNLPSGELDLACLAVLAHALEDAGCTEDGLLSHLRSPGPHVRGCWALDLILGKE
jgi:hypothetical protein